MQQVLDYVLNSKAKLIAIDGVDASGKTTFAKELAENLRAINKEVLVVSIDNFHQSKSFRYQRGENSAEGYYYDSYQYDVFIRNCIEPYKNGLKSILTKCFDLDKDCEVIEFAAINSDTILIVEGIFLHRDEIFKIWDYSIYLDISAETSLVRNIKRSLKSNPNLDVEKYEVKFYKRYKAGQDLYIYQCNPKTRSNLVINNYDENVNLKLLTQNL